MREHSGHILICGQTKSGKTTLARMLAAAHLRLARTVIVHDRMWDDWGQGNPRAFVTMRDEVFLRWCWQARSAAIFLDEASELCSNDRRGEQFHWLATRGRHYGFVCHFIAQGALGVSHKIRGNCTEIYAFRLKRSEAMKLYRETGEEWALATADLPRGSFYHSAPFEPTRLGKVF
jgi:energy-coupling factor transporter ATP-binding protein EcfA2